MIEPILIPYPTAKWENASWPTWNSQAYFAECSPLVLNFAREVTTAPAMASLVLPGPVAALPRLPPSMVPSGWPNLNATLLKLQPSRSRFAGKAGCSNQVPIKLSAGAWCSIEAQETGC